MKDLFLAWHKKVYPSVTDLLCCFLCVLYLYAWVIKTHTNEVIKNDKISIQLTANKTVTTCNRLAILIVYLQL